ncbi:MAG: alpha/beta hydrolase [Asgard group archaeon]|nr:alpha/beta hydrolase [Asgard group archaeon]
MDLERSDFEQSAKKQYIKAFNGIELRVLSFEKVKHPAENIEILFIPGFLTIFPRWEKVVKELNENYKVHYVETREKKTSRFVKRNSMKISEMYKDLDYVEKALDLNKRKYITISSSLGGAIILESLAAKSISPLGSIIIGPGIEIPIKKIARFAMRLIPAFVVYLLKPFIRWYIRTRLVDFEKEPQQATAYIRAVEEADVRKMKKWLLANANRYSGWNNLPNIHNRIVLIGASTDKAHSTDISEKVANALQNCTYVDLGTNKAAHDTPLVDFTKEFIKEL